MQALSRLKPSRTVFGSAHFLEPLKKFKLLNRRNDGLAVERNSRISQELSFRHFLMVSPSGLGKSTKFVLNNLLQPIPGHPSLIITDPSSELFEKSSGYLSEFYEVRKLDFERPHESFSYNPIFNIAESLDIDKLARNLIHSSGKGSPAEAFWRDKAIELVTVIIHSLLHPAIPDSNKNIGNVRVLLNDVRSNNKTLLRFFQSTLHGHLIKEAQSILSMSSRLQDSVVATAKASLRLWTSSQICQITSGNTIRFQDVRHTPVAIFICVPESDAVFYQSLVNQFYSDVFRFLLKMPGDDERSVYLILDEFGNYFLQNFTQILTVARKRRISISALIQSISQLESKYGATEMRTILEGFQTKVFSPNLDLHSCQYLEYLMGRKTVVFRQPHGWFDLFNHRPKEMASRPLMSADEIRKSKHPIMLCQNFAPTLLSQMNPYFENTTLRKRSLLTGSITYPPLPYFSSINLDQDSDQLSASKCLPLNT